MVRLMWAGGLAGAFLLYGCSDYKVAPPAPPKAPVAAPPQTAATSPPAPAAPGGTAAPSPYPAGPVAASPAPPPTMPGGPSLPPPTATPYPPAAPPAGQAKIRLSSGVALAQTLPDGTAMGFHVDYEFVQGQPAGDSSQPQYFWVFERSNGPSGKSPVKLQAKGELDTFVPWRPEEGPFRSHLEDAAGRKLSDSIEMR